MALATWTDEQVFAQLNSGASWSGSIITYSFPATTAGIYTGGGEGAGFTAMTASQQTMAELALRLWDDLITNSIQKASPGSSAYTTNIEFGNSTTNVGYAHAYYPGVGSVWFNNSYSSGINDLVTPTVGIHGFATYIHEIGHAMGLDHMGEYNGSVTQGPSSFQDSTVYSIMSYYGPSWGSGSGAGEGLVAWADWIGADGRRYSPNTPMLNDIMAIQRIYGADMTTRSGDTVYGYSSTIGDTTKAIYDFTINKNPILCIWDGGGNDTLNLSGWTTSSTINLAPGSFSSGNSMTNNISIAYNCNIENAIGGAGSDTISGNTLGNRLSGEGGNDTINGLGGSDTLLGGAGNDTLNGGDGDDTVVFSDNWADITWTYDEVSATFTFLGAALGTDIIRNIEFFIDRNNVLKSITDLIAPTPPTPAPGPDPVLSAVSISASQTSIDEGNDGTRSIVFTLTLDVASDTDQTLDWSIAGTGTSAASAGDFSGSLSGSVTFAAGSTEQTIEILIAGDATWENNETFKLVLANLSAGLQVGTLSPTITIVNDDAVPPVVITGTSYSETLVGTDGIDQISGLGGSDTLYGYAGNDVLNGGNGNDRMIGGDGNDTYYVDSSRDSVTELASGGTDTVRTSISSYRLGNDVENLVFTGTTSFTGIGNALDNVLRGGSGNNVLSGLDGNDTLLGFGGKDILTGGNGADTMNGGEGSDLYMIAWATEHGVAEIADNGTVGTDEVRFSATGSATLTLFAGDTGIERVVIGTGTGSTATTTGTSALGVDASAVLNGLTIIGNAGANTLIGTAFADRIEGGNGNDVINGGNGNDVLVGGAGLDSFVFNTTLGADNIDTISAFSVTDDTINLASSVFSGLSAGLLGSDAFVIGTAAADASDRIIYDNTTGDLWFDADGAGGVDAIRFANVGTGLALTNADFLVI